MSAGHRHTMLADASRSDGLAHEHEFEPVRGLPEVLPPGEQLLWQGSPDWRSLAVQAFHVRKLVVYFALLTALRVAVLMGSSATAAQLVAAALFMATLGAVAVGLTLGLAWLTARTAVYTLTDRRVVMRIGIVLTLAFNIPLKRVEAADMHLHADGSGDIPLALAGDDRIAWLNLWPHVRPWRVAKPEPMMRCVPQAATVARLLAQAWSQQSGVAVSAQPAAAPAAAADQGHAPSGSRQPVLAGH